MTTSITNTSPTEVIVPVPDSSLLLSSAPPTLESRASSSSPNKSPRRLRTDPEGAHSDTDLRLKIFKRLIICCDGTWQDGLSSKQDEYTNVLRMARAVDYEDQRYQPPIPQIVFYQSGVGTDDNFHSKYVDGTRSVLIILAEKVEDAYGFIAHNYNPGDEIFLFGFSRGAYTARMVAMFIGEIGVLDRRDMNNFADIFIGFQKLGEAEGEADRRIAPSEKAELEKKLAPWRKAGAAGKLRADIDRDKFTVKCLGVWDTVGALGLPKEFTPFTAKTARLFGFHDQKLGEHVEHAFHAMGLHELRSDFNVNKFIQTDASKVKKQVLKQCWFAGCHTDIGGGYEHHDLSDISLTWMAGQIEGLLSLDFAYLTSHMEPVEEWGKQQPHDSATGVFFLADKTERELPKGPNDPHTHEIVHRSVLEQENLSPAVTELLSTYPTIVCELTEVEVALKKNWKYDPNSPRAKQYAKTLKKQKETPIPEVVGGRPTSWMNGIKTLVRAVSRKARPPKVKVAEEVTTSENGADTTVGIAATATVSKSLPRSSRSKA
ncbi:hypothetical protein BDN70DRAFT_968333 [Pholiota conissans]|uniref:T6SS Phospholipase effector Tle1-like catalytic domain-containing protein n=1 Tax=Pholiota conissans TaxID=109636 RepID=A0A9P6CW18_9AGAR|nr:hypothetical protein BDN70DRAFT_968333 [Pholiota conissans]